MGRRDTSDARRNLAADKKAEEEQPIAGWLLVLNGNHKGDDFRLREGKNTVGSDPSCAVALMDDHVSEKHASITVKRTGPISAQFRLVDLDSTNGTYHNDNEEPVGMEELVDNDIVSFGRTRCRFKCAG